MITPKYTHYTLVFSVGADFNAQSLNDFADKLKDCRVSYISWSHAVYERDDWKKRAIAAESRVSQLEQELNQAKAKLAELEKQEPVVVISRAEWQEMQNGQDASCSKFDRDMDCFGTMPVFLYAQPKPPPHKGATHCENCGCTWLDDGLNPIGCPYCKGESK